MIRNQHITVDAVLMMQRIRLMIQAPPYFFHDPHLLSFSIASGNTTGAVNGLSSNLLHEKSGFHRVMYHAVHSIEETLSPMNNHIITPTIPHVNANTCHYFVILLVYTCFIALYKYCAHFSTRTILDKAIFFIHPPACSYFVHSFLIYCYKVLDNWEKPQIQKEVKLIHPISIQEFADMTVKSNKGMNKKELIQALRHTLEEKNNGARCIACGSPIWAAGSAITGTNMCFSCTTLEADDSEDYEIY